MFRCHLVTLCRWSRLSYNMRKRKRLKQILWRWDRFSLKGVFSFFKKYTVDNPSDTVEDCHWIAFTRFYISQVQNSRHINISAGCQQVPLPSMLFHSKGWPCWFVDALLCDSADHVDVDSWTHVHVEPAIAVVERCCKCYSTRSCLFHLVWVHGWIDRSNRNDPIHKVSFLLQFSTFLWFSIESLTF